MNRKNFIESLGATCSNWNWSWSFVNHRDKRIFFGAWEDHISKGQALIFSDDWQRNEAGRKQNAWPESRANIRLIEEGGYDLYVYKMICANPDSATVGVGPRKILEIIPEVRLARLNKIGRNWFAEIP